MSDPSTQPTLPLNNGASIPQLGLGVFQIPDEDVQRVVEHALELGYRHIDTAAAYNNEAGVGAALRASGLPRDEVYVTTKLRNGEQGYDSALAAFEASCERLGTEPDLYLIHWPFPSAGKYRDSWRALTTLAAEKRARTIGVSNFLPDHLDDLATDSEVVPAVNQIELHPTFQQADLVDRCLAAGIVVESYSPLGQGADLTAEAVLAVARAHDATAAQAVLAWHLAQGYVVIPKSKTPARLAENFAALELRLTDEEVAAISALEAGQRVGADPATFAMSQIRP